MVEEFSIGGAVEYMREEFGIELPAGRLFLEGKKLFLYTGKEVGLDGRYGMYLGSVENGFRPSVYACQLATKGFTDIDRKEAMTWMCGLDIKKQSTGYYSIMRHGRYILGVGKPKEGRIINNLPKNRRLPLSSL
jgi:NOL1/NOP2/fmu family ribosome biogenesis protein